MTRERIICVTPNAALDRTMVVPDFAIGRISRIQSGLAVAGGKGLNVARAVRVLGGQPLAMGLLGGHTGRMVAALVAEEGYEAEWTPFEGETRTCTIVANAEGVSTVINESGRIAPSDWSALAEDVCRAAARADVTTVCMCGSLPLGAPADAPRGLIERLNRLGLRVWVDSSRTALQNAIAAKPYAIKINRDELAAALGERLQTTRDAITVARLLAAEGIRIVVVTLGAEGALLAQDNLLVTATPPAIQPLDPIASGDCLLAGLVTALAEDAEFPEALRRGVAAGTVNALYAGGAQFPYSHFLRILEDTHIEILPT
ncbi:MAG: 1-phosphofructokinase family hexose kinase [Chloroflexi bacterium]|nr:1-phosphofructokinase family hexose kinase [Chloroflexota bacterium]